MIGHDDVRTLLRSADPAKGRALTPGERARMKAALRNATPKAASSLGPYLALATVTATVLVAAVVLRSPRPVTAPAPVPAPPPAIEQAAPPRPVTASRPERARRAHARPAVLDVTPRTTRIEFTAPEGTRILWFVGSSDEKELGS